MKQKVIKTGQVLDDTIRKACERIPQKKRKIVVLGISFLLVAVFSFMIWNSFHNQDDQKMFELEHIDPLEIPDDTLNRELKIFFHEQ